MKALLPSFRQLQLEHLESRTLLAADLAADFELASKALSGSGAFDAAFSINFGNTQLVLTGHGTEALSVDLDRLPAFITNLKISSFAAVTFTGTDHVDTLMVSDVAKFSAPELSVTKSLHVTNVASIDLASAGVIAVLKGNETSLSVRSLESTMIISDLHSLTLDSQTKALYVVGLNSDQSLNLKYRPETISIAGFTSASVHMLDDFALPPPPAAGSGPATVPSGDASSGSTVVPVEKPVTIITLPLDERTRHLLAELRDMVRGTGRGSEQILSEFMAHTVLPAMGAGVTPPKLLGTSPEALRPNLEMLRWHTAIASEPHPLADLPKSEPSGAVTSDRPAHAPGSGSVLPWINNTLASNRPALEIDATWPLAMPVRAVPDFARPFLPIAKDSEPKVMKLEDSVRAFGSYIFERASAEFSPGEQSLILLVDPKTTRASGSNPTSALEVFARGGRNIITNLRNV